MARGMPPRPSAGGGGGGRPQQPPRAGGQQRGRASGQQPSRAAGQQRGRAGQQQRRGAGAPAKGTPRQQQRQRQQQQHRQRQQTHLFEAHGERRQAEADGLTAQVQARVTQLESILREGLQRSAHIDLDALPRTPPHHPFDPGPLGTPAPQPAWEDFAPAPPTGFGALWGGPTRQARLEAAAREAYERAERAWEQAEQERKERLIAAQQAHEVWLGEKRREVEQYNNRIARVAAGLRARDPKVVESFLRTVLKRVPLPADFPRHAEVTHDPATEQVVLRVQLPGPEVVPTAGDYRYEAAPDEILAVPRPVTECAALYRSVVSQVALLVVRDVFDAEPRLASVVVNGHVDATRAANGAAHAATSGTVHRAVAYPRLVSLRAERGLFAEVPLDRMSPQACLRHLNALISPDPYALEPITTTVDTD